MGTRLLKNVSYVAQVPAYTYRLPCGRAFKSHTYSEVDPGELHFIPCRDRECYPTLDDQPVDNATTAEIPFGYHAYTDAYLRARVEVRPRSAPKKPRKGAFDNVVRGRIIGEGSNRRDMPARLDDALVKDRIAGLLRGGTDMTMEEIARLFGVSEKTVERVGIDLGVYDPNLGESDTKSE